MGEEEESLEASSTWARPKVLGVLACSQGCSFLQPGLCLSTFQGNSASLPFSLLLSQMCSCCGFVPSLLGPAPLPVSFSLAWGSLLHLPNGEQVLGPSSSQSATPLLYPATPVSAPAAGLGQVLAAAAVGTVSQALPGYAVM